MVRLRMRDITLYLIRRIGFGEHPKHGHEATLQCNRKLSELWTVPINQTIHTSVSYAVKPYFNIRKSFTFSFR